MRAISVILVAALVGGCAGGQAGFVKPGASAAEQRNDEVQCAKLSTGSDQNKIGPTLGIDRDVVSDCMSARGYSARPGR